eukprot:TRINITY_DN9410_c1_g1_i1.p2 TRINITY_DN9410_c1_g1~~TRINITY_DN9410_c1_g1_i1.p2  ORF type:complete len:180 (+),score=18.72 TRINITY_DN9410_c1_g1_i1:162-701(+)
MMELRNKFVIRYIKVGRNVSEFLWTKTRKLYWKEGNWLGQILHSYTVMEQGRSANVQLFEGKMRVIYVLNANDDGIIQTKIPDSQDMVEYFLVDGMQGGSGKTYDWSGLQTNLFCSQKWLMAGGLKPENVGLAVQQLAPTGVDVSSGVCAEDGLRKDPEKIKAFIESVRKVSNEPETRV